MLLIYPPAAKACEPPAGIAALAGALKAHGIPCTLLDANIEGQLFLLRQPLEASDSWTRRAARNAGGNIEALRSPGTYASRDRYGRAVRDLNRVLAAASARYGAVAGLADFRHKTLSPLLSSDLLTAGERPEQDPFHHYFRERLPELIEKDGTGVVGVSLNYLSQALTAFAMMGFLRREFPRLRIVLGGGLVTSWMKRPGWKDPFGGLADHLVAGPGEGPLLDLLGVPRENRCRAAPDHPGLPLDGYLSPGFILPYSASTGCWWNRCSFCPEPAEGNPYRPLPVDRAQGEIRDLAARHRPALLHLLDNAVSPALMRALAQDPPGAPWYGFARIGPELADPGFCRELKASGCVMLKLGIESGDQGVLDRLQKGIDLGMASLALGNLRRSGIASYVYLLFGTPEEGEDEARRTLEFTVRHSDAISFLNLAVFNMPLGGSAGQEQGTGPFYDGDLSLYTGFRHPRGWDRSAVRGFLERVFKRHPAVARIVKNDPPVFTSNHAALFARS